MAEEILVELDERRRASLARLDPRHRRYLAHVEDDGAIVLRPVAVVPAVAGAPVVTDVDSAFAALRDAEEAVTRIRDLYRSLPGAS